MLSEEGTTQGDPLAMPVHALGVVSLINALSDDIIKQVWYVRMLMMPSLVVV